MQIIFNEKEFFGVVIEKEFFVLEKEQKIISIISEKKGNKALLCNLSYEINSELLYIGKGYARALINESINHLKEEGVKEIKLLASANKISEKDNRLNQKQLIKFYRKVGFKREPLKETLLKYSQTFSKKEIILRIMEANVVPMILKF